MSFQGSFRAHVYGDNAAMLERKAIVAARGIYGEDVVLQVNPEYLIEQSFGGSRYTAVIYVGPERPEEPEPEADPEHDERTVSVTAEGDNVTELEQDALAKATGFFATFNGDQYDLSTELEVVPDYQAHETRSFMVIEGTMPRKLWTADVVVRVVRSPKPVGRDLTKPVLVHGDFKVYETDYGTFVSADQGGWLPGNYSTPQVARQAYEAYTVPELESLWRRANDKGRVINAGDLPVLPADPEPGEG